MKQSNTTRTNRSVQNNDELKKANIEKEKNEFELIKNDRQIIYKFVQKKMKNDNKLKTNMYFNSSIKS